MPAEHVHLIYLDPPFNSNADYNLLYGTRRGGPSQAQTHAFEDTWKWGKDAQRALEQTAARHLEAGALLDAFQKVFPDSNMMAYLAMMAVRLIELQRVLKPNGALYLHCDPTASHYLKILLDAIFRPQNFRSEIIWRRSGSHNSVTRQFGPIHDCILFVSKSNSHMLRPVLTSHNASYIKSEFRYTDSRGMYRLNEIMGPGIRKGDSGGDWRGYNPGKGRRHWAISETLKVLLPNNGDGLTTQQQLDAIDALGELHISASGRPKYKQRPSKGVPLQDVWAFQPGTEGCLWNEPAAIDDDVKWLTNESEKLGYPTQKPVGLLERIIRSSSDEGDIVLDPFCGCGTAIEAAQSLGRRWIGIDVTYLAIHVIETRLKKIFGDSIARAYRLFGRPKDANDARMLAARDWLEFQKWAVFTIGGLPKDRPGPDGGIDGIIRYHRVGIEQPNRAIVSVKGGLNTGVDAIHKLKSVVDREKAEIGILICLDPPTSPMRKEAVSYGEIGPPSRRASKLQIVTVDMLFQPHPIEIPGMIDAPEIGRQPSPPAPKKSRRY